MKSGGIGSFGSEFMAALILRILISPYLVQTLTKQTQTPRRPARTREIRETFGKTCRFVTTKKNNKKERKKLDRNYDAVATGIPCNKGITMRSPLRQ